MNIDLLDCTIREAPIKDLMFGEKYIQDFINGLEKAKLDVIECGFLKNGDYIKGSTIFRTVEDIQYYLKNKKPNITYVALVDYGRYDLENLSNYDGKSIDGIRICFKKDEKDKVLNYAKQIKDKGYKVFIQHVDTLSYTDIEIINFIEEINKLKPYAYSIVDTFGSMYSDDVLHLCSMIDKHLSKDIKLGFHSHNNLLLATANTQLFISTMYYKRDIMIDTSLLGCGRGAGNAHTELLVQFLNQKYKKEYELNYLLDMIDLLMPTIKEKTNWGYSIPYFLSGIHGAHVFNVNHLLRRHNIYSKDLRQIIEKLNEIEKKQYNYPLLEKLYISHFNNDIDDNDSKILIANIIKNRKILFLLPGSSLINNVDLISKFIKTNNPIVISLNFITDLFPIDLVFFSSQKRFDLYCNSFKNYQFKKIIITSNIKTKAIDNIALINYLSLIKYGWINLDVSAILALRFFTSLNINEYYFAGFDGFSKNNDKFYFDDNLEISVPIDELLLANKETTEMLIDIKNQFKIKLNFLTKSIYENI